MNQISQMKQLTFLLIFLAVFINTNAQDTLVVMQYNLLYYGINTEFCTSANNNLETKDQALRTILNEIKPDIFTVNELSSTITVHQHLLDTDLNFDGETKYKMAAQKPVAFSNICQLVFYNSLKLRLKRQSIAQSVVRDVNVYELYYISDDLAQGDTAFITCVATHLKAGNTSTDETTRNTMVNNTMQYLENGFQSSNLLFMGDFNYYTAFEPGFQSMTNYSNPALRFFDPVNRIGSWNNSSSYSDVHSQSTHTSSTGCASTGGMDDRFDFILISNEVRDGLRHVTYIPETYHAFGQDGNRFNGFINGSPANSVVSQEVADALYNMSDHLPIVMKLKIDKTLNVNEIYGKPFLVSLSPNPVSVTNPNVNIRFQGDFSGDFLLEFINLKGMVVCKETFSNISVNQPVNIDLSKFKSGIYFLKVSNEKGFVHTEKIIVI